MTEKVASTCSNCGKHFIMGWTGVSPSGVDYCDMCYFGYERDSIGKQQARGCLRKFNAIGAIVCVILFIMLLSKWGVI